LEGVTVLVTRPAAEAQRLCGRIEMLGGEAIAFPALAIEPIPLAESDQRCDWLIFVSANAVRHGLRHIRRTETTRVAAIGKATAAALSAFDVRIDAMPEKNFSSEALLTHPAFANVGGQTILIVKGCDGRELLQETLTQRGARVAALEVYRRVRPKVDPAAIEQLEKRWHDDGVAITTLLSVETLENLLTMLTDLGRTLLKATPFVTLSDRIVAAARGAGLRGECVLSRDADDDAIVGTIAAWHARAR
jgi:uroporphyrinogen-III synthase